MVTHERLDLQPLFRFIARNTVEQYPLRVNRFARSIPLARLNNENKRLRKLIDLQKRAAL